MCTQKHIAASNSHSNLRVSYPVFYLHDIVLINKENGSMTFIDPDLNIAGSRASHSVSTNSISNNAENDNNYHEELQQEYEELAETGTEAEIEEVANAKDDNDFEANK